MLSNLLQEKHEPTFLLSLQEQNLIAVQCNSEIYYEACKDIAQGTELLVWYGDCYLQFMGIPVALKEMADGGNHEEPHSKGQTNFPCYRMVVGDLRQALTKTYPQQRYVEVRIMTDSHGFAEWYILARQFDNLVSFLTL